MWAISNEDTHRLHIFSLKRFTFSSRLYEPPKKLVFSSLLWWVGILGKLLALILFYKERRRQKRQIERVSPLLDVFLFDCLTDALAMSFAVFSVQTFLEDATVSSSPASVPSLLHGNTIFLTQPRRFFTAYNQQSFSYVQRRSGIISG